MNNVIKIIQLNKGDSHLENRTEHINIILNNQKPHIMILNELNVALGDQITKNSFGKYKLETDNLEITDKFARTGVLIHPDIKYKRRRDLESPGTSTLWLQLSYPGRKFMLLQAVYRQFQRLGVDKSETVKAQEIRWERIISKWESAIQEEREILSLGDFNFNTLRWETPVNDKTLYEKQQMSMVKIFKDRILEKGFKILNSQPTRTRDGTETKLSCLDLIVTNKTEKIASYQTGLPSFSDHSMQLVMRSTKSIATNPKYLRTRSYKNFNKTQYQENIQNHPKFIQVHYEEDPSTITSIIQGIIKDSLEIMAPMKRIQLSDKNQNKLPEEIRSALVDRDLAHELAKQTKDPEEIRNYKNLRNSVNRMISKEKSRKKVERLQKQDTGNTQKWKNLKQETGQMNFTAPQEIKEGSKSHTSHLDMANSLNRQYLSKIRKLVLEMGEQHHNPIQDYKRSIGQTSTFTFKCISMHQLRLELSRMKSSSSSGEDDITIRLIKQAQNQLESMLLHLINRIIKTRKYPEPLKISKIVPILKKGKEKTTADAWRPVNVVIAISKIVERVLLRQIMSHLEENALIKHSHHGAIKNKSTQTLVNDLHNALMETMNKNEDAYLLLLDQSKAYEIVCHDLLLQKLKVIGFQNQATELIASFVKNRKQYVQIEGLKSELLDLGPRSVIQGSTLSGVFFLIFILDMPDVFHYQEDQNETECQSVNHSPVEQRKCPAPSLRTFVDDGYVLGKRKDDETFLDSIQKTMSKLENYMSANRLLLNSDKSQVMLFTKDKEIKKNFKIILKGKTIKHKTEVTILGNTMKDDLTWDCHVEKNVIPQLRNRVRTLRMMSKYLDRGFRALYANAIFKSKLLFGIESWGGVGASLLNKLQSIQDQASKLAVPRQFMFKSSRQRETILKWRSIRNEIAWATHCQTFKVLNFSIPEELALVMPLNTNGLRMTSQKKLDTKPRWLVQTKAGRAAFRNRAYSFNILPKRVTSQILYKDFRKELKKHFSKN